MHTRTLIAALFALITAAAPPAFSQAGQLADPELARQILLMKQEDQQVRNERFPLHANEERYMRAMLEVDERHRQVVRKIFDEKGWPGPALVGQEAADGFWLLVQHFPALLEQALPLMQAAADRGELSKARLAKSIDRVRVMQGKPQLYGTQFKLIDGDLVPDPIENEAHVNERRKEMGLDSFEDGWARLRRDYLRPKPGN